MSRENVEVVVRGFELARSDPASFLSICDPEIEWDMTRFMPEAGVYIGHEGVREFWRRWAGTWEDFRVEIEQAVDAGGDDVAVQIRNAGRGRGSGAAVEVHFGQVWTVKGGKVVRLRSFSTFHEALEAAGLSE